MCIQSFADNAFLFRKLKIYNTNNGQTALFLYKDIHTNYELWKTVVPIL